MAEVGALAERVGAVVPEATHYRQLLNEVLRVRRSPKFALVGLREVLEDVVGAVLVANGITARMGLARAIEVLSDSGSTCGPTPGRVLPRHIQRYAHSVREAGNLGAHGSGQHTGVRPTDTDVDAVFLATLRVLEWYFTEYDLGPRLPSLYTPGRSSTPPTTPGACTPRLPVAKESPAPEAGPGPASIEGVGITPRSLEPIELTPKIRLRDLAVKLNMDQFELQRELMDYNIFAGINQPVSASYAQKIAEKHGYKVVIQAADP